jgi:hypothetical protein
LAGDPVGDGDATGEAAVTGLAAGAGLAGGLFGVSGFVSHAAKIAVAVARAVVNINFLIVFLLTRLRAAALKGERTLSVRRKWFTAG